MSVIVRQRPDKDDDWYVFVNDQKLIAMGISKSGRKAWAFGKDETAARAAGADLEKALALNKMADALPQLAAFLKLQEPEPEKQPVKTLREFCGPISDGKKKEQYQILEDNNGIKPKSRRIYASHLRNHILPYIGDMPIDTITRDRCKTLIGKDLIRLSQPNAIITLSTLSVVLNAAIEAKLIEHHPARELNDQTKRAAVAIEKVKALDESQLMQFLQAIRDGLYHSRQDTETVYMLFMLMAYSGLRIGEAVALQRLDIDLHLMRIAVRRTMGEKKDEFGTPKTGKLRYVDINSDLVPHLTRYMNATMAEQTALLFRNTTGGVMWPQVLGEDIIRPVRDGIGLPWITSHTMRHTYASQQLAGGEMDKLYYVQRQLGHATPQMTLNIYGHFIVRKGERPVDSVSIPLQPQAAPAAQPLQPATPAQPATTTNVVTGAFGRKVG